MSDTQYTEPRSLSPQDVLSLVRKAGQQGFQRRDLSLADGPKAPFQPRSLTGDPAPEDPAAQPAAVDAPQPQAAPEPTVTAAPPAPKTAPAAPVDLDTLRDEAFAAGRSEGYEAGLTQGRIDGQKAAEIAGQQQLTQAATALESAVQSLRRVDPLAVSGLTDSLTSAILTLAAQRAGMAIDDSPKAFVTRIEALATRVTDTLAQAQVRLHPDDISAITPHLDGTAFTAEALTADPTLSRGDARISVGAISVSDILGNGAAG